MMGDLTWLGAAVWWGAFAAVFGSGVWLGMALGYRVKLREASRLTWARRPDGKATAFLERDAPEMFIRDGPPPLRRARDR